jgi:MFS family permease
MGIIGLIAWLIPLIGMILGVLSLVFGTMSTRSSHRNLAIAGIVLGSITIALSLFGFVLNVQSAAKQQSASQNISTSIVQPVETNDSNLLQLLLQPY